MDELSGGWRRRVALPRRWYPNPTFAARRADQSPRHHARSNGSRTRYGITAAQCCSSRTIAASWSAWPRASSTSTAASSAAGRRLQRLLEQKAVASRRGSAQRAVRQEARAGRSLDSQGRQGPPDTQRRPRAGTRRAARSRARERIKPPAHRAHRDQRIPGCFRAQGHRSAQRHHTATGGRRSARRIFTAGDARRSARHHRQQRRRQEHAAANSARRARAGSGTVKLGTNLEIGYFDQLRRELDPEKTVAGDHRRRPRLRDRSRATKARRLATSRIFCSPQTRPDAHRGAVGRRAQPRDPREALHARRKLLVSTSRPTISTSRRSRRSKPGSRITTAR